MLQTDQLSLLRAKLEEALQDAQRELETLREEIETEADYGLGEGDPAIVEREMAMAMIEEVEGRIKTIEAALQRMEEGTYGICVECGAEIPYERLEIIPETPYCVQCAAKKR
ncbi:hypothetical protein ARMA_0970 [Ardenticatena maritima]|uniref:Zinc finger DksA/TraR C4-type domain-containing protein n=1 Tax=Ardenticatena maritima TaxID=872965 RepID=A0A0M9UC85_9CHLR|nr:TraR/DksA C4-type zinc finger protein [Ardenticatena maritima]KPL88521.1 hypothetical protein SE16_06970 [Ardenticatena maritima]GAP62547.1 hypothetical protein ARMA_0970 [Ardenticatena maritima]